MTGALRVVHAGLGSTVQDAGRFGFQRFGVPTAGALDRVALTAANILVGNAPDAAAIEMLYLGATFEVACDSARVACVGLGARLEVTTDGSSVSVPGGESRRLLRGARVRVLIGPTAISAVLAIEGGLALAPVMGSLSTFTRGGIGGFAGRALADDDRVPLRLESVDERAEATLPGLDLTPPPFIRLVLGPQADYFTPKALATLVEGAYTITRAADRMGYRLDGPPLEHAKGYNIVSDGIAPGSIQVPGDGLPIILLADRQTTGGYPKIATVASVDLPALGRLGPGTALRFEVIAVADAEAMRRAQAREEATWRGRLEAPSRQAAIDPARLLSHNLVSGVADALGEN